MPARDTFLPSSDLHQSMRSHWLDTRTRSTVVLGAGALTKRPLLLPVQGPVLIRPHTQSDRWGYFGHRQSTRALVIIETLLVVRNPHEIQGLDLTEL